MKTIFLFLLITISAISCKKDTGVPDPIVTTNVSQTTNSHTSKDEQTNKIKIEIIYAAEWVSLYKDCISGWWYCWKVTVTPDAKNYIAMNDKDKIITFGIDYSTNPDYDNQFIKENEFNFPQDTYISSSVVKAAIGVDKEILVKKGLYPLVINDGILIITAPYTILE